MVTRLARYSSYRLSARSVRAALVTALCALLLLFAPGQPPAAAAHPTALRDLPAAAQAAVSGVLGRDDDAYAARATLAGYRIDNPAQRISAEFTGAGLTVTSAGASWGLALQGAGYGNMLSAVAAAEPRASANRVEYARGALTEWYVNGPQGLEQGFTLASPPAGERQGALTLALALTGGVSGRPNADGHELSLAQGSSESPLRYTGLSAYDATGRELRAWLEAGDPAGAAVQIRVDDAGALYPVTIDPWVQQGTISDAQEVNDQFGISVAMSADGSTIVAGAQNATVSFHLKQGAVYVFVKPAGGWSVATETAKLTVSTGVAQDHFGFAVAISADGSTVVAGAPYVSSSRGAAYVYVKSGAWASSSTPNAKLTASDAAASDALGYSVSVSSDGSIVAAGAQSATVSSNTSQGAAYVFVRPGGSWASVTQSAKLTASDGAGGDNLGYSVSISADGSAIIAGASSAKVSGHSLQGAAYVFVNPGSWATATQTAKLTASDGATFDSLGQSVSINSNGSMVAVAAPSASGGAGAVYVYVKSGAWATTSTFTAKLTPAGGGGSDNFGWGVAISSDGSTIVAGAPGATVGANAKQGAAYTYRKPGGGWATTSSFAARLTGSPGHANDLMGSFVATSSDGSYFVAGDPAGDTFNPAAGPGFANVFGPPPPVQSTSDSGSGSLRGAIASASSGDVITFSNSLVGQTIVLTSAEIPITLALTLDASNAPGVKLDGNGAHRVLNASAPLTIIGLIIQNGSVTGSGGGISSNSGLTLTNVTFVSDTATVQGGGLNATGPLVLNGATFGHNSCTAAGCLSSDWFAGSTLALAQAINVGDNIQNQGSTTQAAGSVILFNGAGGQTITGTGSTTFNDMWLANTGAGVSLGQNITVTDRLTLTSDLTTTGSYALNLTLNALSAGAGDVWGRTHRGHAFVAGTTYPFGNPNVSVDFSAGAAPGDMTVNLAHTIPNTANFANAIKRIYDISQVGGGGFTAALRLHYNPGEINGNDPNNLQLWYYASPNGPWTAVPVTASDPVAAWAESNALTHFSPWVISQNGPSAPTAVSLDSFHAQPGAPRADDRLSAFGLLGGPGGAVWALGLAGSLLGLALAMLASRAKR